VTGRAIRRWQRLVHRERIRRALTVYRCRCIRWWGMDDAWLRRVAAGRRGRRYECCETREWRERLAQFRAARAAHAILPVRGTSHGWWAEVAEDAGLRRVARLLRVAHSDGCDARAALAAAEARERRMRIAMEHAWALAPPGSHAEAVLRAALAQPAPPATIPVRWPPMTIEEVPYQSAPSPGAAEAGSGEETPDGD